MAAVAGTEAGNWRSGLQGGTFMLLRAHAMFSVSVTVILELTGHYHSLLSPPLLFPLSFSCPWLPGEHRRRCRSCVSHKEAVLPCGGDDYQLQRLDAGTYYKYIYIRWLFLHLSAT